MSKNRGTAQEVQNSRDSLEMQDVLMRVISKVEREILFEQDMEKIVIKAKMGKAQ